MQVGPSPHAQAQRSIGGSDSHLGIGLRTHTHPTGPFWVIAPKKILCLKKNLKTKKKIPKHKPMTLG